MAHQATESISKLPSVEIKYQDGNPEEKCGRLLTRADYLKQEEEKRRQKRDKEIAKELSKKERERKRVEKQTQAAQRKKSHKGK